MIRRPPTSTRTDTLFPYTTLFRSLRIVPLTSFVLAKVKRKQCVAYNDYPENIVLRAVANYVARRFRVVASSRDRIVRGVLEAMRSEEHTSELQSLMRTSYAVFCLKKKTKKTQIAYSNKS